MTIEIGLLFGAIACIIGLAGFFGGRQSAAKNDGERWGRLEANLDFIQKDLKEIKSTNAENAKSTRESLRRVHERIDNHLKNDHGFAISRQNDT